MALTISKWVGTWAERTIWPRLLGDFKGTDHLAMALGDFKGTDHLAMAPRRFPRWGTDYLARLLGDFKGGGT
ncbi:unnamed protein product [Rhizophagus irregularis]|nr:unnamed protein product [Rhizophagus irregularis]